MKYEGRIKFYEKLQKEFDMCRMQGLDRLIVLDTLSDKYGITKTSIRNNIDTYRMEKEARKYVAQITK